MYRIVISIFLLQFLYTFTIAQNQAYEAVLSYDETGSVPVCLSVARYEIGDTLVIPIISTIVRKYSFCLTGNTLFECYQYYSASGEPGWFLGEVKLDQKLREDLGRIPKTEKKAFLDKKSCKCLEEVRLKFKNEKLDIHVGEKQVVQVSMTDSISLEGVIQVINKTCELY